MRLSAPIYQLKRRARKLVRDENMTLHQAQDRIAVNEGFSAWSLLATRASAPGDAISILPELADGDMPLTKVGAAPCSRWNTRSGRQGSASMRCPTDCLAPCQRSLLRTVFVPTTLSAI